MSGPDADPFIIRLAAGAVRGRAFAGAGSQEIGLIEVTETAVFVGGTFQDPIDLGGGALRSRGGTDFFVAELAPDMTHRWSRRFGDGDFDVLRALVATGLDALLIAGSFLGELDLERPPLASAGSSDIFLAELGPSGHVRWARRFGDPADQVAAGLVRSGPRVYLLGAFEGSVDVGLGSMPSAGDLDVLLTRYW